MADHRGKQTTKATELKKTAKMLDLSIRDVNASTIARATETDNSEVQRRLKPFSKLIDLCKSGKLKEYRNIKSDILTASEMLLLQSMLTNDKLLKASVHNLAFAFDKVATHNRLEQNLSTSNNVNIFSKLEHLKGFDADNDN